MPGIAKICQDINPKCPHCNERIDLSRYVPELFRRILHYLRKNGRVSVHNFGAFHAKYVLKSRLLPAIPGVKSLSKPHHTTPKRIIRFRASATAKTFINDVPTPSSVPSVEKAKQKA